MAGLSKSPASPHATRQGRGTGVPYFSLGTQSEVTRALRGRKLFALKAPIYQLATIICRLAQDQRQPSASGKSARKPIPPITLAHMPPTPPEQPDRPKPAVLIKSPRDATTWALVYRRRNREKPRDRLLKAAALFGAFLIHLIFLLGAILGSPYDLPPPPPEPKGTSLLVRLINNKPQPPPPPPVRGTPPKEHGPTHRGNTSQVAHATHEVSTAAPVAAVQQPPAPAPKQPPVVTQAKPAVSEKPQPAAAPLPPITLPKPSPAQVVDVKPVGLPPPPLSLQAIQAPQPVPPQFQPEPPRKPQAEGTQPMPPLPSLALPTQPAQSAVTAAPPQIAVEKPSLAPIPMPQIAPVAPAPTPAAPPAPTLQPIPMPAMPAPSVNVQPSATPLETPNVQRTAQQVVSPALRPQAPQQEPQLAPVPVTPVTAPAPNITPSAPSLTVEAPKLAVPAVSLQPQLSPAPAATPSTPQSKPAEAPSNEKTASETSAPANQPESSNAPANQGNASASTAPNATPEGSETANPGQPNGINQPSENQGTQGTQPSASNGAGNTPNAQGTGTYGTSNGTYIQLKPRGDTEIMSHNTNLPKYRATRFDQYWTPEGESSVDTALRHAVEKTTASHTFNLPQGVRIKCTVMPLLPSALFGCTNPDPPAAPLPKKIYDRLNLPTTSASVPKVAPAAAATQAGPAAPVVLDNSAECAAARVSGGPLPPNCPATSEPVTPVTPVAPVAPGKPLRLPASASTSWVPASDQFH
jgi:hypothetical protein